MDIVTLYKADELSWHDAYIIYACAHALTEPGMNDGKGASKREGGSMALVDANSIYIQRESSSFCVMLLYLVRS